MIGPLWLTLCSYFANALEFDTLLIQLNDTWSFSWLFPIFFCVIEETFFRNLHSLKIVCRVSGVILSGCLLIPQWAWCGGFCNCYPCFITEIPVILVKANLHTAICWADLLATTNRGANRRVWIAIRCARDFNPTSRPIQKNLWPLHRFSLVEPDFKNGNATCKRIGAKQITSAVF